MRLWGKIYTDGQKQSESLVSIEVNKKYELHANTELLTNAIAELAYNLDLERPVMVKKHIRDLCEYGRAVFLPQDFMEQINFDRLVVEIIP